MYIVGEFISFDFDSVKNPQQIHETDVHDGSQRYWSLQLAHEVSSQSTLQAPTAAAADLRSCHILA